MLGGLEFTEKGCYPLSRFATFAHDFTRFNESWRKTIVAPDPNDDGRHDHLLTWLANFEGFDQVELEPASVDASFRRYFRVQSGAESFIVMDAPPPHEDCQPFVQIAGYLESMGLNCPRVLGADLDNGFVLMTDLGTTRYIDELERDRSRASALYSDAIDALLMLQEKGEAYQQQLPTYDYDFIALELSIFRDWLCGRHLGIDFTDEEEKHWQECCEFLIDNALRQTQVFTHRDYHSRNLMVTAENNPGILDFQDAVEGPITYDVVSLFKDCYIKWPAEQIESWAIKYFGRLKDELKNGISDSEFLIQFHLIGVQRHLKAAGIFARLNHRDDKPGYLADIPRTLEYIIDTAPQFPELNFLTDLVMKRVVPAMTEKA